MDYKKLFDLTGKVAVVTGGTGYLGSENVKILKDFGATAMCCTPSYFTFLIEKAQQMGIDLKELPIKVGIFGAEPWTPAMREQIEKSANIKAYDIYGLSEIIGPGVAIECECQQGLHMFEDHFYPEIIDPDTLEVLPDGEWGELVITTLSKEAMPMIRYRTRDLTRIIPEKCACGRTIRRIDRISSRSDDMMIINKELERYSPELAKRPQIIVCNKTDILEEGSITCPSCNELLEFDIDCDCDDCCE